MLSFAQIFRCSSNRFVRALDADGNGYVDFLEFIMVNNLVCARTPREKLSWAFKVSVYCD